MLLDALNKEGIAEQTIFVFTSDHGDMIYSQGLLKKQHPFDESIRVPFILRYPEIQESRKITVDIPFNTPDILPTLLGLADIEIPGTVEGTDFSGIVRGERKIRDNAALISCYSPFGEWDRNKGGMEYRGIRTKRYTYVRTLTGPWLFFDNETDPFQQHNLAGLPAHARKQRKLEKTLNQKLLDMGDEFLAGEEYIKKWGYVVDETGTIPYNR